MNFEITEGKRLFSEILKHSDFLFYFQCDTGLKAYYKCVEKDCPATGFINRVTGQFDMTKHTPQEITRHFQFSKFRKTMAYSRSTKYPPIRVAQS